VTYSSRPNESASNPASQPALADGENGAVLQRDGATYAIAPHIPCGLVTPALLRKIADTAERYHCAALKLTSAERIALIGVRAQDVDAIWNELGMQPGGLLGERVRSVRVCPGTDYCKRGQQNSLKIGKVLDAKYHGKSMPGKFKISVSGCPNQCTETATKDIGLVGTRQGWDLWVGGMGGVNPQLGTRIAQRCSDEAVLNLVDRVFEFYQTNSRRNQALKPTYRAVSIISVCST
jgi:NAD(P)H-nitrite reductase large subunit